MYGDGGSTIVVGMISHSITVDVTFCSRIRESITVFQVALHELRARGAHVHNARTKALRHGNRVALAPAHKPANNVRNRLCHCTHSSPAAMIVLHFQSVSRRVSRVSSAQVAIAHRHTTTPNPVHRRCSIHAYGLAAEAFRCPQVRSHTIETNQQNVRVYTSGEHHLATGFGHFT